MSEVRRTQVTSFSQFGVWAVWALMLGAALWFVVRYGSATFFGDDWAIAPVLTGEKSVSAAWLWPQHNEHRIPIPRLILLGLYAATDNNLRAPMFFNVLLLAALSFAMILRAATLRGRLQVTDAIFPLVLLHLGQAENLIWSWQVGFVLPSVLVGVLLLLIVSGTSFRGRAYHGLLAGICLLLLPLCGANGLLWAFPLAIWACFATVPLLWSASRSEQFGGVAAVVLLLLTAVVSVLYVVGYARPANHPPPPNLVELLKTSLVFLSTSFGMLGSLGAVALLFSIVGASALLLLGVAPAVAAIGRDARPTHSSTGDEWIRAAGILLLMAGPILLALAIGWGRSALGTGFGSADRYTTLLAPAFCGVYFAWMLYGGSAGKALQTILFVFAALLVPIHAAQGVDWAKQRRSKLADSERDLRAGVAANQLATRHADALGGVPPVELERHFRTMQAAGIGEFRGLQSGAITRQDRS